MRDSRMTQYPLPLQGEEVRSCRPLPGRGRGTHQLDASCESGCGLCQRPRPLQATVKDDGLGGANEHVKQK
jgi:hypothetical protein